MPSNLHDQVILITGGNAGLGKETAKRLAAQGASHIWIAARDQSRSLSAIEEIKAISASQKKVSRSNSEQTIWATPFSSRLLLPLLSRTATEYGGIPRIILINFVAHEFAPSPQGICFETLKSNAAKISTDKRYAQSKLANVLFIYELAKRSPKVLAVAVHPGTVKTDLQKSNDGSLLLQFFQKCVVPLVGVGVEEGAKNQVWAMMDSGVESGQYYVPVGVRRPGSAQSRDEKLMERLWEWTERELEAYLER